MISICIPVYNTDIRTLAALLSKMADNLTIPWEIRVLDDGSKEEYKLLNRSIQQPGKVIYEELPVNTGRSAIRNKLAQKAQFPFILFLDADSMPVDNLFLQIYADMATRADVVCGGTFYDENPPETDHMLRWIYGRKREMVALSVRKKKGFAITANNFMIRRDLLIRIPFRESIRHYGHEDTVLGYDLVQAGYPPVHIHNPVWHLGLEPSGEYLAKTRNAIENLVEISDKIVNDARFLNDSGLLRLRKKVKDLRLVRICSLIFRILEPLLRRHLTGPAPTLLLFDLYRAAYICSLK